jgi:hypothetical protein
MNLLNLARKLFPVKSGFCVNKKKSFYKGTKENKLSGTDDTIDSTNRKISLLSESHNTLPQQLRQILD